MSSQFDPYSEWLDIETDQRPPSDYQLLGLPAVLPDAEAIEAAYHQRYALVRRYQVGEHSAQAVRLLQELSKAFDKLTSEVQQQERERQPGSAGGNTMFS